MKLFYLVIAICCTSFLVKAQNFVYSTPMHLVDTLEGSSEENDIKFKPQVAKNTTFLWSTIEKSIPAEWDVSVCDHINCYVGVPKKGVMTPITKEEFDNGTEAFMKLTAIHMNVPGEAFVKFLVYDEANPTMGDTITFRLIYGETASLTDHGTTSEIQLYPNPASDKLFIASDSKEIQVVSIYDQLGRKKFSETMNLKQGVNVSELEKGVYLVTFEDQQGNRYQDRFIKK